MPINYNLRARNHLKKLLKQSDKSFTLNTLYDETRALLTEYDENPEISHAANISFLNSLSSRISAFYDKHVYQNKSLWGKFLYFIGWLNTEESEAISLIKQISARIKSLEAERNPLGFFDKFLLYFINRAVDDSLSNDEIKNKMRYLSHRSLTRVGDVPKNLEGNIGKLAYKDYINDLQDYQTTLQSDSGSSELITKLILQLQRCEENEKELLQHRIEYSYLNVLERTEEKKTHDEQCVQDNIFKVLDTILKLEIGETALFNHGFSTNEGSHATVYEVEKVSEDEVVFRFINTGIGLNQVESWQTLLKGFFVNSNQSPIKVTSPIAIDSLITSSLISQLVRPKVVALEDIETGVQEMVAPLLELYQQNQLHDDKSQARHQAMGSCSQSCIDAWLETQLNEDELTRFHIRRLNKTLNQIESLLQLDTLDTEQREYCQHMRIAANAELTLLKTKLDTLNNRLEKEKQEAIDSLMLVRKENSAYKNRDPKPINIEQYLSEKLSSTRLKQKFTEEEQRKIQETSPAERVEVRKRKVVKDLKHQLTFGIWGTKTETALTEEDRRINKLNKVLLAQKIRNTQEFIQQNTKMKNAIRPGFFTEQEQKRITLLAEHIMQNKPVLYSFLDPKVPATLEELYEMQPPRMQ